MAEGDRFESEALGCGSVPYHPSLSGRSDVADGGFELEGFA